MKILAVVPARSGSKGFPNKNIAKVNGVTLLEIAINVAINCSLITDVYISTDSDEYMGIAERAGAKSKGLRKLHLANDEAKVLQLSRNAKKRAGDFTPQQFERQLREVIGD